MREKTLNQNTVSLHACCFLYFPNHYLFNLQTILKQYREQKHTLIFMNKWTCNPPPPLQKWNSIIFFSLFTIVYQWDGYYRTCSVGLSVCRSVCTSWRPDAASLRVASFPKSPPRLPTHPPPHPLHLLSLSADRHLCAGATAPNCQQGCSVARVPKCLRDPTTNERKKRVQKFLYSENNITSIIIERKIKILVINWLLYYCTP